MNQIIPTDWIENILRDTYGFICAIALTVIGYFIPVKNIVHLVLFFFLLDVIFGYWAARKLRNECFQVKIIWNHTIPRILISIVVILAAFMWDNTFGQEFVSSYKIIGWFIAGVLLYSVAENGYQITSWKVFSDIGSIVKKKVETETGETLECNKNQTNP